MICRNRQNHLSLHSAQDGCRGLGDPACARSRWRDVDLSTPIVGDAKSGYADRPATERDLVVTILELNYPGARFSEPGHCSIELA